jgi:hypothetical protein
MSILLPLSSEPCVNVMGLSLRWDCVGIKNQRWNTLEAHLVAISRALKHIGSTPSRYLER